MLVLVWGDRRDHGADAEASQLQIDNRHMNLLHILLGVPHDSRVFL